jgi:hypothetical protein
LGVFSLKLHRTDKPTGSEAWPSLYQGRQQRSLEKPGGREGTQMPDQSVYGSYAESKADAAAARTGDEDRTDAIGEGLAAVAYALLDVAAAIRENSEARQQ